MFSGYTRTVQRTTRYRASEARERILLGAAIADLREALYHQQCLLFALIDILAERTGLDETEVLDRARAISARDLPDLPLQD